MIEIKVLIEKAIEELEQDGMNPDIILAGPGFLEHARDALREFKGLKIYRIEELGYDAVIADSHYLGQIKKASYRVSVEPLLEERDVWEQIEKLTV
ncbi:family 4B encapsulin nanocompartment shell protein [Thermococcus sp.]|uniref:family 4B encapsulin nanocompartment shell protein n=1 Tax=Thermococcus sp. TaxID=35749 RepID=UPI00262182AF|nr:family 4B encapsulin nanocompartment shell protein [Thermococcus sp.]